MRLNITLVLMALISLLVGFNADFLSKDKSTIADIYGFCDSLAWVLFSLFAFLLVRSLKVIGKDEPYQRNVKRLKITTKIFMVLSICPLINECAGKACDKLITNYIYGSFVIIIYLTSWIVKKYRNARIKG